jgi:hypothetical protein
VVDCFDALTSDRPYRRAMTEGAALGILRERSGKMYDPAVVDMFIKVFRDIPVAGHDAAETTEVMQRIAQSKHEAPAPVVEAAAAPSAFAASSNLLACVSLARVAGGKAAPDGLPCRQPGPRHPAGGHRCLVCSGPLARSARGGRRSAGGDDARGILRRRRRPSTGWVAASRQPILNSDASLDLAGRQEGNEPRLLTCMACHDRRGDARGRPEPLFR